MVNVCLGDELIQQSVSLLVVNLVLNGDERVLEVHDSILKLHGAFWHVCLLPSCLDKFLLSLYFGFGDVLCRRLHILDDLGLSFLELGKVLVFLLSDHCLQLLQVIALRGKLISVEVVV